MPATQLWYWLWITWPTMDEVEDPEDDNLLSYGCGYDEAEKQARNDEAFDPMPS